MDSQPNILFVLVDQLGARWLPTYGHQTVQTPELDSFAAESTVFERAITTSPVCTPYRGCLLSGRYPSQTGVLQNGQAYPAEVQSLAHHLNDAGYATHYVGKWHLSGAPQENRWVPPEKRAGFQHFVGWESHHVDHNAGLIWRDDPDKPIEMPDHETDALTDIAIQQLSKAAQGDKPFFMMVAYQAPHPPCSPPVQYRALYESPELLSEPNADSSAWYHRPHWNADYDVETFRELYFGEISQLDTAFGRLMTALDERDLKENTLVVFTSDHGEMAGARGLFGKGLMYEEALHVPLIVREPGQTSSHSTATPAATVDLMPTILDYAGCLFDEQREGISLRPWIEGAGSCQERNVFSEHHDFCVTNSRWKLISDGRSLKPHALYNIVDDRFEMQNRLDDPESVAEQNELSQALAHWHNRVIVGNGRPAIHKSAQAENKN